MTYKEFFEKILKEKDISKIDMDFIRKVAFYFSNEEDFYAIKSVIKLLKENEIEMAIRYIGNLDTIVRDAICDILEEV